MKICNQCQAENPDTLEICEACGASLLCEEPAEELVQPEETAAEEPVEEIVEEAAEVAGEASEQTEEAPAKPKKRTLGVVAIVAAVVAVLAIVIGVSQKKAEAPAEESTAVETPAEETVISAGHHVNAYGLPSHSIHYAAQPDGTFAYTYLNEAGETVSVSQEELDALMAQEVASCADMAINNSLFMFYYDDQMYNFTSTYSSYLTYMMNTAQALDEQIGMDGANTWEQLFVDSGFEMFHQIASAAAQAKAEGFTLSAADQENVDTVEARLEESAANYGYESAEAYLQAYFGPAAKLEDYVAYYQINVFVNAYLSHVQSQIVNTPEELSDYYDENAQMMQETYGIEKEDKKMVNVRHILIKPEATTAEDGTNTITDEAWAAAEAQAKKIYDEWENVDPTESYFAGLAAMYTADPGSQNNGGLYEEVYPGQMVQEFNDWCFADGRAAGDTGIVRTTYGYHLMYFVSHCEYTYWELAANDMLTSQKMSDYIANLRAGQELTADQSKVVLMNKIAPTVPAAEETTEEAAEETAAP